MTAYTKTKLNRVKRGANRASYDQAKVNEILDSGFVGYLSYVFEGTSICLPMAYGREGKRIFLHGSQANRMLLSLLEQDSVSMTVMHLDALVLARSGLHHSVNYRSATIFGSVTKVEDDDEKDFALKTVMDHMIPGRWETLRSMTNEERDRTLVLTLTIESASAKIRDVGVNDEPADEQLPIWAGLIPVEQSIGAPISDPKLAKDVAIPEHILQYVKTDTL
ncbi:Pyridoxamine 5'-phosphate oxidase-related, FMN-binding [Tenacibaculum litopenaei]|uniref:pyridoxamine 5'-phosphate oxidase family protein n=1 Tax=Tenacibaculum litopenaei TaxID=396016 RepID=UPI003894FBDD